MKISIFNQMVAGSILAVGIFAAGQTQALEVGDTAPCVQLQHIGLDGKLIDHCLTQPNQPGQNVAIVFFGTSCGPCVSELPLLKQLTAETAGKGTLRLAMTDKDVTKVTKFLEAKKNLINMELALDKNHAAVKAFEVQFTPTMFVVSPQDKILFQKVGVLDSNEYNKVKDLLMSSGN